MALITGPGLIIAGALTAVLSSIVAAEIRAWSPSIIRSLIKFAVGRLPENQRQRFEEEWQSHVNDVPGCVGKFLVAVGFSIAAYDVALNDRRNQMLESRLQLLTELDEVHSAMITVANVIQNDQILASDQVLCPLVNSLRSLVSESEENCRQLTTLYEAYASATSSQTLVKKLWYDSVLRRKSHQNKVREQLSQGTKQIREKADLIVKRVGERTRSRGR